MSSDKNFALFGRFEKEARVCYETLAAASEQAIEFRRHLDPSTYTRKDDGSPVTVFDLILQAMLLKDIVKEFPGEEIIAEESESSDLGPKFQQTLKQMIPSDINISELFSHAHKTVPSTCTRYWTIDPIDGTSGFKRENGQYAIAIAIIENNDCAFSAIAWPNAPPIYTGRAKTETLYCFAARGCGSYIATRESDFEKIVVPPKTPDVVLIPPNMRPPREEKMNKVLAALGLHCDQLCFTSMTKAISLCLGVGCIYFRFPFGTDEYVFDIAPISTFVEEAGAIVTLGDGKKVVFTNEGTAVGSSRGIFFSNRGPEFHKRLVEAYSQHFTT